MSSILDDLDYMFIGLASPEKIREWSFGEVTKQETINYRTHRPEFGGLFCERIFGPEKDFRCSSHCENYNREQERFSVCPECGVEITYSRVRRERMGHIELVEPVVHSWYFRGRSNYITDILGMKRKDLENVIYCSSRVITDPGDTEYEMYQVISQFEYTQALSKYTKRNGYEVGFKTDIGARIIRKMLEEVDLNELANELKERINETGSAGERRKLRRRLKTVTAFLESGNRPEWMVLTALPVLPPELRPMVQIDGGRFASSDINELYRKVINRNNRLKDHKNIGSPDILLENGMRLLQEGVDELISNTPTGRRRPATGNGNQPLKSLEDMLKGKRGRFRQNLLGKRVDYSGRSVIVAGPNLRMNEVGLPRKMAIKLFEPFIIRELLRRNLAFSAKNAKNKIELGHKDAWKVLKDVVEHHPVILNRAPTLHRLSIRAFEPKLIDGEAIELHPLVCAGFNADFDGDQMAVHVPIGIEAQLEARMLMYSTENLIHPQNGKSSNTPNQDMILGIYYLTQTREGEKGEGKYFPNVEAVKRAYENNWVSLHSKIIFNLQNMKPASKEKYIITTPGKIIFNESLPEEIDFINDTEITRSPVGSFSDISKAEKMLKKTKTNPYDKSFVDRLIDHAYDYIGKEQTVKMLDAMMDNGFKYALKGGLTFSLFDISSSTNKDEVISSSEEEVKKIEHLYKLGRITEEVRYQKVIEIWTKASEEVALDAYESLKEEETNNILMMIESGARGNKSQYRQLAAMRGLMSNPNGTTIETPITSNFSEGLSVYEYFTSTHGSRKGMVDTALKTADSGYLTRRLVDVAQTVIIDQEDCGTDRFSTVRRIEPNIVSLEERIYGRVIAEDIVDDYGVKLASKGTLIDKYLAEDIARSVSEVKIRTATICESKSGVCSSCYGINLATRKKVEVGEAVGVIAAQSIGEPGTQLTMRTFHTGGVAGEGDITQGLPRVEEIFEARKQEANASVLSHNEGIVEIEQVGLIKEITVTEDSGDQKSRVYRVPYGRKVLVKDGERVERGQPLTAGAKNLEELTKLRGIEETLSYIIEEVLKVYKSQGVTISEKHIEIIAKQMARKVRITDPGDTGLRNGAILDRDEVQFRNQTLLIGEEKAEYEDIIQGITAASLSVSSFLSAASFQETSSVLSKAAIEGARDNLLGLKESVIVGKLIPAGTGYYSDKRRNQNN